MYQIKLNSYLDIITDDLNLNIRNFYIFMDKVESINYINKAGFVLEYNNKLYFFRFTKDEIDYFNRKQYRQLPFIYQRLIRKYHILNGIIETESERNEYLEMILYSKPNYFEILKSNIKNKKYSLKTIIKKSIEEYKDSLQEWNNKLQSIANYIDEENNKTYKKKR